MRGAWKTRTRDNRGWQQIRSEEGRHTNGYVADHGWWDSQSAHVRKVTSTHVLSLLAPLGIPGLSGVERVYLQEGPHHSRSSRSALASVFVHRTVLVLVHWHNTLWCKNLAARYRV